MNRNNQIYDNPSKHITINSFADIYENVRGLTIDRKKYTNLWSTPSY